MKLAFTLLFTLSLSTGEVYGIGLCERADTKLSGSQNKKEQLREAAQGLRSGDPDSRQRAKGTLIKLGARSLPVLLPLLGEMMPGQTNDIREILQSIPPAQAVPYFIHVLEQRPVDNLIVKITADLEALILIGPVAIPYLVESMETIGTRIRSTRFAGPPISEEQKQAIFVGEAFKVQSRIALVLGEIGDASATDPLKRLLEPPNDPSMIENLRPEVEMALEKIEKKSHSGPR